MMAELFGKDVRTINEHIYNVFAEGELVADSVIPKFRITAADGKSYNTQHYNLEVIIAAGYRVNHRAAPNSGSGRPELNEGADDKEAAGGAPAVQHHCSHDCATLRKRRKAGTWCVARFKVTIRDLKTTQPSPVTTPATSTHSSTTRAPSFARQTRRRLDTISHAPHASSAPAPGSGMIARICAR